MPLTPAQAFKIGFLQHCAERGYSMEETHSLVKQAIQHKKSAGIKDLWDVATGLASTGAIAGLAAPVALGAAGGYTAAKLPSMTDKNLVEEAKQDEIVGEYERLADEARRRARLKRLQQETGRRVIALTPQT
jgi:hypothetical protein